MLRRLVLPVVQVLRKEKESLQEMHAAIRKKRLMWYVRHATVFTTGIVNARQIILASMVTMPATAKKRSVQHFPAGK